MLPVTAGLEATRRHILFYSYLLVPATLLPVFLHEAGLLYTLAALTLGAGFLARARGCRTEASDAAAKRLFGYSILYLFALFAFLMIDKEVDKYLQLALTSMRAG